jgi:hypothetical protein
MSHASREDTTACEPPEEQDGLQDLQVSVSKTPHLASAIAYTATAITELDELNAMRVGPRVAVA